MQGWGTPLCTTTISSPTQAKAIGAITCLRHAGAGASLTINVEYNQLDPLLRATPGWEAGDVNDASGRRGAKGGVWVVSDVEDLPAADRCAMDWSGGSLAQVRSWAHAPPCSADGKRVFTVACACVGEHECSWLLDSSA
jgi:hypothetical protein